MDIASRSKYPANALSNFAPHEFTLDGVVCKSAEGWLQSLKYKNPAMQVHICTLVGKKAKFAGAKKTWWRKQTLWWQGKSYDRHADEYQDLLDRAYAAMAKNKKFRNALLASGDSVLTHSIGRTNSRETILTQREFCSRLTKLREVIKNEVKRQIRRA